MRGGDGDDYLEGDVGNDNIDGGDDNDELEGGFGDDIVNGGEDADSLTGGLGNDTFVFNTNLDSFDTIVDFSNFTILIVGPAQDDQIRLDSDIFTALTNGPLPETQYNENTSGTAEDATDRIIYDTDSGELYYDPDGTGLIAPTQFADLDNLANIGFEDFFVT